MNNLTTKSDRPIRIFIGSSSRNFIEEKVFIYSLINSSTLPIEINIINGENNSVKFHSGEEKEITSIAEGRLKKATAFSLARFAIPQWCGYQGKAIYCDSDQIVLTDISELWNYDLCDKSLAAVHVKDSRSGEHYVSSFLQKLIDSRDDHYLTSVMVMDCSKLTCWDIEAIVNSLDAHEFSYTDMMFLNRKFTNRFSTQVNSLPSEWNHLDIVLKDSKLVHFTDLSSQPWLFHHNPVASLWENFFLEAVEKSFLSREELSQAYTRGLISKRIETLPFMGKPLRQYLNILWRSWGSLVYGLNNLLKMKFVLLKSKLKKIIKNTLWLSING